MQVSHLLIADNSHRFCEQIGTWAKKRGISSIQAHNIDDCHRLCRENNFDIILLNSRIAHGDILENLREFLVLPYKPEVIVLTDIPDPTEAEEVIKSGAWDYIEKSQSITRVGQPILTIARFRNQKQPEKQQEIFYERFKEEGIIGESAAIGKCMELASRAAGSNVNVLISGETGTGKELFATAIHDFSSRANRNFVVVDCASLPENLVESILFGHERGAFTSADKQQTGLIKQADGGTLFLDEVGELPLSIQKSFLRVLQEKRFRPVGGKLETFSNFRLISATNKNLTEMAQKKLFRSDLLFRLRALSIELPPLRERKDDINLLSRFFLSNLSQSYGIPEKLLFPDFLAALNKYHWPGNVRELYHALERALTAGMDHPAIYAKHLPVHIRAEVIKNSLTTEKEEASQKIDIQPTMKRSARQTGNFPKMQDVRDSVLGEVEREYLREVARRANGDIVTACKMSGLSRSRLYALLKKYELKMTA